MLSSLVQRESTLLIAGWWMGTGLGGVWLGAVAAILAADDCSRASESRCGEPEKGTAWGRTLETELTELKIPSLTDWVWEGVKKRELKDHARRHLVILSHLEDGVQGLGEEVGPVLRVIHLRSLSPEKGNSSRGSGVCSSGTHKNGWKKTKNGWE